MAEKLRCMCCMHIVPEDMDTCPYCGQFPIPEQSLPYLPVESVIGDRYIVGKALKVYAEGVTYIGYDTLHNKTVDIREFFPLDIVKRGGVDMSIRVKIEAQDIYYTYLQSFVQMWRTLMKMHKTSAFAGVIDIINNENLTSYVITEHIDGVSLENYLLNHDLRLPWENVKQLFAPAISTLEELHSLDIIHGAISPSTLFVSNDGRLMFSDFAIPEYCNETNGYIFDGYSPIECYNTGYPYGTWTDIYGYTASMYHTVTGLIPPKSTDRAAKDQLMIQREIVNTLPTGVIKVMFNGMRILPPDRIKTTADLLGVSPSAENKEEKSEKTEKTEDKQQKKPTQTKEKKTNRQQKDENQDRIQDGFIDDRKVELEEYSNKLLVNQADNDKKSGNNKGGFVLLIKTAIITFVILCAATALIYPTLLHKYIEIPQFEPYVQLFSFIPGNVTEPETTQETTAKPTTIKKIKVPDVLNNSYQTAFDTLTKAGFKVRKIKIDNPGDKKENTVASVSPNVGQKCVTGSLITVKVYGSVSQQK